MGRLFLHIGTHKTGTTTIQRSLSASRTQLLERGIVYPDYSAIGLPAHYAHLGVANALAGEHDVITVAQAEAFFAHVAVETAGGKSDAIVSAEPMWRQVLSSTPPYAMNRAGEYWEARDRYIGKLADLVGDATIVVVVRRQAEFSQSMYQEHVKVTRYKEDFEFFLRDFWFHFDYLGQYQAWKRRFPNVMIVRYDDIAGPTITKRFLNRIGLKPGRLKSVAATNVGLSTDAVVIKRLLNHSSRSKADIENTAKMIDRKISELGLGNKRSFFSSWKAMARFQLSLEDDNVLLAKLSGHERLFDDIAESTGTSFGDFLNSRVADMIVAQLEAALPS
jgi:hypothetical protein